MNTSLGQGVSRVVRTIPDCFLLGVKVVVVQLSGELLGPGALPGSAAEGSVDEEAERQHDDHDGGDERSLESVQQSHFGSGFAFHHFNLPIEKQIGVQMRRTIVPHLKPILNTSKL